MEAPPPDGKKEGTLNDPERILTPREEEVLSLAAEGHTNKGIALRLGLSVHTVNGHMERILHKLNAPNRTAAVLFYYRRRREP
ncbi:MAG: LuxR C-terminal-related transcriptional regulator [Dehalococcoidia bacterium]|nr:LuxR C-terminal-related transcriptional regulator [Dehalococcoidia bacterium]